MDRTWRWFGFVVAVVCVCACGGGGADSGPSWPSLTVRNESQFVLLALKMHWSFDYSDATDLLAGEPLLQQEEITIPRFATGAYVTVIRDQVHNGPPIAITTATPIDAYAGAYALLVFDESFRLFAP